MVKHVKGRDVSGIFLLNKPLGLSSNKALQKVKYYYQAKKAGHTGSLDPLATGVLPVFLGEATKFSQYLLDADKAYLARIKFGAQTSTGDSEGVVIARAEVNFSFQMLIAVLENSLGDQEQIPSMFSAIKLNGQPLYKLARKGLDVERKPRKITLHALEARSDEALLTEHSAVEVYVSCSKGTYIRNLAEDLAKKLDCVAHLERLHRVKAGCFEDMQTLSVLEQDHDIDRVRLSDSVEPSPSFAQYLDRIDQLLLPIDAGLTRFQVLHVDEALAEDLKCGRVSRQTFDPQEYSGVLRIYITPKQAPATPVFLGLAEVDQEGKIRAKRMVKT